MKNVIYYTILTFGAIGMTIYFSFFQKEDPTLGSIRIKTAEAQQREKEATEARIRSEDNLSQALYNQCYSQSLTLSGTRFDEQQRKAYECWRDELTKINTGSTDAPQASVPPKSITSKNANIESNIRYTREEVPTHRTQILGSKTSYSRPVVQVQKTHSWTLWSSKSNPKWGNVSKEKKYWKAYLVAVNQITKWEGLRLASYWDFAHCSIGYWFSYPCGKSITQKQADMMLADHITARLKEIQKDFPNLSPEKQGVLVSFAHNCPAGYKSLRDNWLKYHSQWCKTAGGDRLQGLINRRAEEAKILFSK